MPNAAHKPHVPTPESALNYEKEIFSHHESGGALEMGANRLVADTAVGEQVELNPMHTLSVHEIYTKMAEHFKAKSAADQAQALADMEKNLGVELHTADGTEVDSKASTDVNVSKAELVETKEPTSQREKYDRLMHKLAEDIYDALVRAKKSLGIVKPESVGGDIHKKLSRPGDANFLVARGEGDNLLESLRKQNAAFRVLKHNSYGFVMENKEIGFRCLFIFQERIDEAGNLITPEIEETEVESTSPRAKEASPEHTEGNVAGATTAKNERATVPEEDHKPDATAQFAARGQKRANIGSSSASRPVDFGAAANVPSRDTVIYN